MSIGWGHWFDNFGWVRRSDVINVRLHPSHIPLMLEILRAKKDALRNQGSERANKLREIIYRLEHAE